MPSCRSAIGDDADRRREQEQPQHAGDRRRHRVGPDQQRLVDRARRARRGRRTPRAAARSTSPTTATSTREDRRDLERREVVRVVEQRREVVEPDELGLRAERVLHQQRLVERLRRRPEEEDERDRDLRRDQRVRQPRRAEDDALFHAIVAGRRRREARRGVTDGAAAVRRRCYLLAFSNLREHARCRA